MYQVLCVPVPELELGLHNGTGTHFVSQVLYVPVPESELGLRNGSGTQSVPDPLCPCPRVRIRVTQWDWDTKCTKPFVSIAQS